MTDSPWQVIARALQRQAADPDQHTPNPSSVWIEPAAREAVKALSDAGYEIVKRQMTDAS